MSYKIVILVLILSATSCTKGSNDFAAKITEARQLNIDLVPEVAKGLPFYIEKTMTPTWEKTSNRVKIPQFNFTDHHGQTVTEQSLKGTNTVISFIFTSCVGFCPMLVSKMKSLAQTLSAHPETQYYLITVDPEVDTPERLFDFSEQHKLAKNQNWKLLTGSKDAIYGLVRETFASEVKRLDSDSIRKFAHTEHFYILDKNSDLRGILNGGDLKLNAKAADLFKQL